MSESDLQTAVTSFGRVNFEARCTVDGAAARIVMDVTRIGMAATSVVGHLLVASFDETTVDHEPGSPEVRVRLGGTEFTASFGDEAEAVRLVRVLGVRQQAERARNGTSDVPVRVVPASYGGRRPPANEYEKWAENTLFASTALFVVAGLLLVVGVAVAAVSASDGEGGMGLIWLVLAAAGAVMPVCLGALARTVVLRFRQEDARR